MERYRPLIEKTVKSNVRFQGNEDLLEDFCSETFKRCYKILDPTAGSVQNVDAYISKVATSAIIEVLRQSGRIRKFRSGKPITPVRLQKVVYQTHDDGELAYDIEDPAPSAEESLIKQEEVRLLRDAVFSLDSKYKHKQFLELFTLRYIQGLKQSDIAFRLGITQGEVSKRLLELSKKILTRVYK